MHHSRLFSTVCWLWPISFLLGCSAPSGEHLSPSVVSSGSPLHVLVLVDVSRSVDGRVPRPRPEEFAPVLDAVQRRGGVVAFGSFGVGAPPFVRSTFTLRIASQVQRNVFLRSKSAQQDARAAEEAYQQRCVAERGRFLAEMAGRLRASEGATNLVAACQRAEAFFAELPQDASAALVLVSDLQDTTGASSFELQLDPRVRLLAVLPNARDFGLLQSQADQFAVFESVSAALDAAVKETPQ